ncbi:MAG: PAS domain S-box protein [Clostridia bacterium]|nr:PAS domain S-box protein [Clostridia bacterium]
MDQPINVLFISDSEEYTREIKEEIKRWGFYIFSVRVADYAELCNEMGMRKWHLIISDYAVGQLSFLDVMPLLSEIGYELPIIILSDCREEKDMLEAIEKGCSDYIIKNDFARLHLSVCRVLKEAAVCNSRKKMMEKYYAENKRLNLTLDSIGDGVIITDKEGIIIMLNKVAQSYTGWSQHEALGNSINKVFHIIDKTSRIPMENIFDKVIREGTPTGLKSNAILVSRDCTERYVSANCAPILMGNKGFTGAILVFRDITLIKRAEDEIIREQENLAAMFNAAPVGMMLLDQNAAVKKVNDAIYDIAGKDPFTQITYKKIGEIFSCPYGCDCSNNCSDKEECQKCGLNAIIKKACSLKKAIINTEIQYMGSSWLRFNSVPVIIEGEPHTLVIIDDITELKQLQEELRNSNQELQEILEELTMTQNQLIQQEKMAGIGQLAAGVAHEINNPLGFVMSNFDTLKNYVRKYKRILDAYKELRNEELNSGNQNVESKLMNIIEVEKAEKIHFITEDMEDLFRDTSEGLERIAKIIMGLRLFSRVDQQNEFDECDLNEGINNTLTVAQNEIRYYAVVEKDLGDIPMIHANGGQINQVLLNLIVNAVHAIKSKDSGEMGKIKISTGYDDKFVYCCIEDNGEGIAEENMHKIFDPFYTTKSVGQGVGLGLSISYDIITNKHGGELLVRSTKGVGSVFTIKLPIHK